MKFAERLKEARIFKNFSVKQLAKLLVVTERTINYWEKGERECSLEMLLKISAILDISIDYLLGNDNFKII